MEDQGFEFMRSSPCQISKKRIFTNAPSDEGRESVSPQVHFFVSVWQAAPSLQGSGLVVSQPFAAVTVRVYRTEKNGNRLVFCPSSLIVHPPPPTIPSSSRSSAACPSFTLIHTNPCHTTQVLSAEMPRDVFSPRWSLSFSTGGPS